MKIRQARKICEYATDMGRNRSVGKVAKAMRTIWHLKNGNPTRGDVSKNTVLACARCLVNWGGDAVHYG
jgi:hypothetical protein